MIPGNTAIFVLLVAMGFALPLYAAFKAKRLDGAWSMSGRTIGCLVVEGILGLGLWLGWDHWNAMVLVAVLWVASGLGSFLLIFFGGGYHKMDPAEARRQWEEGKLTRDHDCVYVQLLDEEVRVLRAVPVMRLEGERYKLLATSDYDPDNERWEFPPGSIVECEMRDSSEGPLLTAVRVVDNS